MNTNSMVQINGEAGRPAEGVVVRDSTNRERVSRLLLQDRERFLESVNAGEFYKMIWVKFKIIDGCNIKCVMCNHWRREEYKKSFLTSERLMSMGYELAALGTLHINWSGGEPTLRKDLPEIIKHYHSLGMRSTLISNGTRMTEEYARRLSDARLTRLLLSLESSNPEIHDRVVGSQGAWRKLIDGVGYLTRASAEYPSISFTTVLTSINVGPALPALVPLASRLGVAEVRFTPVGVSHLKPEESALLPDEGQIERLRNEYLPEMREMGRHLGVSVHVDGGDAEDFEEVSGEVRSDSASHISPDGLHAQGHYSHHTCYLPWYHCLVDWRGNVFACGHADADGLLGNITETPLIEVLRADPAQRFRRSLNTEDVPFSCRDCVMQIAENQQIERDLGI